MTGEVGSLIVPIEASTTGLKSTLQTAEAMVEKSGQTMASKLEAAGAKMSQVGSTMTKYVTVPALAAGAAMIKFASDSEETASKINVVFGDSAQQMTSWSETTIDTLGLAGDTALDMAAKYGDMATSMGFTQEAAAGMGEELVGRAADLASFKNISIDVADTALTAVFTGETESLKNLGVVMTQTNLDAYALEQGLGKTTSEMSEQELVSLRLDYVLSKTSNAAGDFARTSDSSANQMRKTKEQLKELAAGFGKQLLPVLNSVLKPISGLLKGFTDMSPAGKTVVLAMAGVAAAGGPALKAFGKLTTSAGTLNKFWGTIKSDGFVNAIKGTTNAANKDAVATAKLLLEKSQLKLMEEQATLSKAKLTLAELQNSSSADAATIATVKQNVATAELSVSSATTAVSQNTLSVANKSAAVSTTTFGAALNAALPWLGAISVGITLLTSLFGDLFGAAGDAKSEIEEASDAFQESQAVLQAEAEHASDLADELIRLNEEQANGADVSVALRSVTAQLVDIYPELTEHVDETTGAILTSADALRQFIDQAAKTAEIDALKERLKEVNKETLEYETMFDMAEYDVDTGKYTVNVKAKFNSLSDEDQEMEFDSKEQLDAAKEHVKNTEDFEVPVSFAAFLSTTEENDVYDLYKEKDVLLEKLEGSYAEEASLVSAQNEKMQQYYEDANTIKEEYLSDMSSLMTQEISLYDGSVDDMVKVMTKNAEIYSNYAINIDKVAPKFAEFGDAGKVAFDNLLASGVDLAPIFAELAEGGEGATQKMEDLIEAFGGVDEGAESVANATAGVNAYFGDTSLAIGMLSETTEDELAETLNLLSDNSAEIPDKYKEIAVLAMQGYGEELVKSGEITQEDLNSIITVLTTGEGTLPENWRSLATKCLGAYQTKTAALSDITDDDINDIKASIGAGLTKVTATTRTKAAKMVEAYGDELVSLGVITGDELEAAKTVLNDPSKQLDADTQKVAIKAVEKFNETMGTLPSEADSVATDTSDAYGEKIEGISESTETTMDDAGTAISDNTSIEESAAKKGDGFSLSFATAIAENFSILSGAGEKIGEAFIDGVDQGMRDARFGLYETARWIARSTKAVFTGIWAIASPSKVGKGLGSNFVGSIGLGFKDKAEEVTKQATQLANQIVKASTSALAVSQGDNYNNTSISYNNSRTIHATYQSSVQSGEDSRALEFVDFKNNLKRGLLS